MRTPHVLITGGSRGIGLSIASLFARHGHRCTLLSRSEAPLRTAVVSLNEQHPLPSASAQHAYIAGDIASPAFWSASGIGAQLPAKEEGSRLDVLVNCAGITQGSLFVATEADRIQNIVDTNLTGMMVGTRFLLRGRYFGGAPRKDVREGKGNRCIINVASLLATHGGHGAVAYAASKAGVLGFTRALAAELGRQGVRVNAVVPGYVETDMTGGLDHAALSQRIPLGRLGKPEEIASAALFLAQNEYAHNCVINIDGGLSAV
ncbi:NAD(P)-binding protein [Karstenula rhodostoma CBS 690.94]|uniref:NAD(P)-binding protein n=1 Tax=Karstenula rhodostoma CBS 690.94 TaxID=1392251 RepID=A0A9P4UG12_9PLEO|nr:NAD(P)-binding protein [Karstenula rhodostoma CBS 690.94]